jgi:transposase
MLPKQMFSIFPACEKKCNIRGIIADTNTMNGLTVSEMVKILGRMPSTIKKQLKAAGIKPIEYAGPTAVYDKSAIEAIRNVPSRGRPPKKAKPE